jgi:leader peptidase (prepilin peptidase)/N-methyltransferase
MANTLAPDVFSLVVAASAIVGLAVGSFLNVVICRVPDGRSVLRPRSACPACGALVSAYDNIPIVSWFVLRGRCRSCAAPISARYPFVEALTAVLFGLIAAREGASTTLPAELVFTAGIIALGAIDLEHYLLPRRVVYPTLALVVVGIVAAASAGGQWHRLWIAAAWGAGAFAAFAALHISKPEWLGFGDVRLAGLLGVALGWVGSWYPVLALVAANLAGAVVGVAMLAMGRATRRSPLPYGVFLAGGSVFSLLTGATIIGWYAQHFVR